MAVKTIMDVIAKNANWVALIDAAKVGLPVQISIERCFLTIISK